MLLTSGSAPQTIASSVQQALGAGVQIDVLIELRPLSDQWTALDDATLARAVHAGTVLYPAASAGSTDAYETDGVRLQPVVAAARIGLGADDALDLIAVPGEDGTVRLVIGGVPVVIAGGRLSAAALQGWSDPQEASVVTMLAPLTPADGELIAGLRPRLVVGVQASGELAPLTAIAGPARAIDLSTSDDVRLVLLGGRVAVRYRDHPHVAR